MAEGMAEAGAFDVAHLPVNASNRQSSHSVHEEKSSHKCMANPNVDTAVATEMTPVGSGDENDQRSDQRGGMLNRRAAANITGRGGT